MHILIVDITSKLPASLYGGTERVIHGLGKSLVNKGCEVTYLIAKGSSLSFAKVVEYDPEADLKNQIKKIKNTDIVHFHSFTGFLKLDTPYVFTMHGNANKKTVFDLNTIFVSKKSCFQTWFKLLCVQWIVLGRLFSS